MEGLNIALASQRSHLGSVHEEPVLDQFDGMLLWTPRGQEDKSAEVAGRLLEEEEEGEDDEMIIDSEDDEMLKMLEPFGGSWNHTWNEDLSTGAVEQLRDRVVAVEEEKRVLMERLADAETELVRAATPAAAVRKARPGTAGPAASRRAPSPKKKPRAMTAGTERKPITCTRLREKRDVFKDLRAVFDEQCCLGEFEIKAHMTNNKFYRLIRDCHLKSENISNTVIDLLFTKLTAERGVKLMDFPIFLTGLKEIAVIKYHNKQKCTQTEKLNAMLRLAEEYIIPMARPDDRIDEWKALQHPRVAALWKNSHSSMKVVFDWYARSGGMKGSDDSTSADPSTEMEQMSLSELIRFSTDYELVPELISVLQLAQMFRIVNRKFSDPEVEGDVYNIDQNQWYEILGRIAIRGYATWFEGKPGGKKKPTIGDKIQFVLDWMENSSGIQVSVCRSGFTLFPKGRKPPVEMEEAAVKMQTAARGKLARNRVRRIISPEDMEEQQVGSPGVQLRPRHLIMKELRLVFSEQCCIGELDVKHTMSGMKFYKLMRDCKITGPTCTNVMVDLLFKRVTAKRIQDPACPDPHSPMDFDLFVTALKDIGRRRLNMNDGKIAMLTIADRFILPKLRVIDSDSELAMLQEREVQQVWRQSSKPLRSLYNHWAQGDLSAITGRSTQEQLLEMNEMSFNEFIMFARAFRLIPTVASIYQLGFLFREVNRSEVADDNANDLSFEEFIEILGRCAIRWYDKNFDKYGNPRGKVHKASKQQPVITAQKVQCLLEQLDSSKGIDEFQVATGISSFTLFPRGRHRKLWYTQWEAASYVQATWRMRQQRQWYLGYLKAKREREAAPAHQIALRRKRQAIMGDLKLIFEELCSMWEAEVTHVMNNSKFYKMLRDCKVLDKNVTSSFVDLLYNKHTANNHAQQNGLNWQQFQMMLREVAQRRLKVTNPTMALLVLVDDFMVPRMQHLLTNYDKETSTVVEAEYLTKNLWQKSEISLKAVYEYYAGYEAAVNKLGRSAEEVTAEFVEMSMTELDKLCRDFEIVPVFFSRVEMGKIFRLVNRAGEDSMNVVADDNANNLNYAEFKQVLLRMAYRAYNAKFSSPTELLKWYEQRNVPKDILHSEVTMADKLQWFLDHMEASEGPAKFCLAKGRTLFTLFPTGRATRPMSSVDAAITLQKHFRGIFSRAGILQGADSQARIDRLHARDEQHARQHGIKKWTRDSSKEMKERHRQELAAIQIQRVARGKRSRGITEMRKRNFAAEQRPPPRPRPVGSAGRSRGLPGGSNLETVVEERESEREDSPGDKPRRARGRRRSGEKRASSSDEMPLPPPPLEGRTEYVPGRSMGASRR